MATTTSLERQLGQLSDELNGVMTGDRVRIIRCPRCNRVYSVVPPQTEADAEADHDAEYHEGTGP
jgi:hypothetical protein